MLPLSTVQVLLALVDGDLSEFEAAEVDKSEVLEAEDIAGATRLATATVRRMQVQVEVAHAAVGTATQFAGHAVVTVVLWAGGQKGSVRSWAGRSADSSSRQAPYLLQVCLELGEVLGPEGLRRRAHGAGKAGRHGRCSGGGKRAWRHIFLRGGR